MGLDGATGGDRTGVEQELLGECGLACVGMADDRERATTRGFAEHLGGHPPEAIGGAAIAEAAGRRLGDAVEAQRFGDLSGIDADGLGEGADPFGEARSVRWV